MYFIKSVEYKFVEEYIIIFNYNLEPPPNNITSKPKLWNKPLPCGGGGSLQGSETNEHSPISYHIN